MTKTEYAEYLRTDHWQELRNDILGEIDHCQRCSIPRWLGEIAYDQDLNVHHKHYRSLRNEEFSDLEVLCKRCHEIATFGVSQLKAPKQMRCSLCRSTHWNPRSDICSTCYQVTGTPWLFSVRTSMHPFLDKTIGQSITEVLEWSPQKANSPAHYFRV